MIANKIACGLLILVLVLPAGAAWGEETESAASASTPSRPFEADEYIEVAVPYAPTSNTIATKLPVPLHLTPSHVGAVAGALLREQDASVLTDALINISGVNIQAGSGVHDYFVLRGFNSLDGSLILTDGAAEPEVSYYNMYNVDGVEVLKGPSGFLYGANPLAGAVNIIRKQPVPGDFLTVEGSLGSYDTREASVDWNLASDDGNRAFRLNAFSRDSEHYRDTKDSSQLAVNPSLMLRLSEQTSLNFNLEYAESDFTPDGGLPLVDNRVPDVPRDRSYDSPFDFSEQEILRFQVDFETQLSDSFKLRNKAYHRDLDWQSNGTLILGATPAAFGGDVFRFLTLLDDRQKLSGNQLELAVRFETGPVTHQLLAGIEYTRLEDDFALLNDFLPTINAFDPVETATVSMPFPFTTGETTSEVFAPYVIDQIEFSTRFQMQVGARYDNITSEAYFDVNAQEPALNGAGFTRTDTELSPRVGLVFAPRPDVTVFANAAESFAPVGSRVVEAQFLDPERSRQVEIGSKKKLLGGRLQASAAVYRIERDRIAITDGSGFTQQAGDQESEGLEFELAAEPLPRLRTFFNYAYNDATLTRFNERLLGGTVVDRSGNDPAFAPEHLAHLWVSRSFESGLGVGGGVRYVSEQFIDEDNAFAIDAYTIVDAVVSYDFDEFRLKLNVKNLTDEDYETRGFGAGSVIPADPLTVFAGFEWRR